ncbi:heat shock 70 kDa protein 12A-like [Mercenaria mercenaria]|uniref:heat shock 70 kDa protein 12A-like n=1 Tax=Mercenaria mercenaria TaxID=6596 RepID=UPI00234E409D|nr:heat shock 70 kDa protein 12A-like [Mercenaria mercenaria]
MEVFTFEPEVVVAFDFGTTYSGYAFAFKHDPTKVVINPTWASSSVRLYKAPTCVLLTPDKNFHSFGFEAENKYAILVEEKASRGWLFFRNFKMLLHNKEMLSRETIVKDINDNEMPAMDIFSMSIGYLRNMFLKAVESKSRDFRENRTLYVLTVPAMWAEKAKQFMREAAIKAGIDTMRLKLALEPEVAVLCCQKDECLINPEMQFMVIDLGGGTADIGCYSKNTDGSLKQTFLATGGPWGGICVDENFLKTLKLLFGEKVLKDCSEKNPDEYFDLLRGFETNKRSIGSELNDDTDCKAFTIPYSIRNNMSEISQTPEERFIDRYPGKKIVMIKDKLKLDTSVVRTWFDGPIDRLIEEIKYILGQQEVEIALLVGGFGECIYLQEKLKKEMDHKSKKLIVPNEVGLAVLKGAVIYGFNPNAVSVRVMKYSYGIETVRDFDKKKDEENDVVVLNRKKKVDHIFIPFVLAGETVTVGQKVKMTFTPTGETESLLKIYRSENPNVKLTTDCERIGTLRVLLSAGHKKFKVKMVFGQTELIVKAKVKKSENELHAVFDCFM